ncbi:MAG: hypothetical protein ACREQ9_04075 [Candidatus Binatia bacterium]
MKLSSERKLFLGLKVDAGMKRQIDEGHARGRPIFKPGDPAHLELLQEGTELYIGRLIDPGFSIDQIEDLKRNIRSIIGISFPDHKMSGVSLRLFAVDADEAAPGFAAAG